MHKQNALKLNKKTLLVVSIALFSFLALFISISVSNAVDSKANDDTIKNIELTKVEDPNVRGQLKVSWEDDLHESAYSVQLIRKQDKGSEQIPYTQTVQGATETVFKNVVTGKYYARVIASQTSRRADSDNCIIFQLEKRSNWEEKFKDISLVPIDRQNDIQWLFAYQVANGNNGKYAPLLSVNRGAMAEFLYNMAGHPTAPTSENPFKDISKLSQQRQEAIIWVYNSGITEGYGSKDIYGPNAVVTRAQMATFIYRLFGKPTLTKEQAQFPDVPETSAHYDSIKWLASVEVTTGNGGLYYPGSPVNRGSMAQFLRRAFDFSMGKEFKTTATCIYSVDPNEIMQGTTQPVNILSNFFDKKQKNYKLTDVTQPNSITTPDKISINAVGEMNSPLNLTVADFAQPGEHLLKVQPPNPSEDNSGFFYINVIASGEQVFSFDITTAEDNTFTLPDCAMNDQDTNYWLVNWGDGNQEFVQIKSGVFENKSHTYSAQKKYTVSIKPADPTTHEYKADATAWMTRFGCANVDFVAVSNFMITTINTPLTWQMTRTDINTAPDHEYSSMFMQCQHLNFDKSSAFSLPQDVTTAGEFYAYQMFDACTALVTLPDAFNFASGIKDAKQYFAAMMFYQCAKLTSTVNLTLPNMMETASDYFGYSMFEDCTSLQTANQFNFSEKITTVGESFARSMFQGCTKLASMTSVKFPIVITATTQPTDAFMDTFRNCKLLVGKIADIIGSNVAPTTPRGTFSGCTGMTDYQAYAGTNWVSEL